MNLQEEKLCETGSRAFILEQRLLKNPIIRTIFEKAPSIGMPNWHLGAGCIAQTFWNIEYGLNPTYGIKDYDLVYFDENISHEKEDEFIRRGRELFFDIGDIIEIRNEARVHLWYEEHFGYPINPYQSMEEAVGSWPTIAAAVAVRYDHDDGFIICAPFGLDDLFSLVVRPNKKQITKEIYDRRVERWAACWPKLDIVDW
ncbi:MAG: nucleotidyltransferase family protein [Candidatus Colwellbacteria bacterium]|nr:nucleotidyltransferase family protein [Candidatus Colwellbacteria bacterium]